MTRPSCIWHVRLAVDTAGAADVAAVAVAVALAVALAHALWRARWLGSEHRQRGSPGCEPRHFGMNTGKFDFESYTSETDLETAATVQHPTLLPVFCPCLRFGDPANSAHHGAVPVDRFSSSNEGHGERRPTTDRRRRSHAALFAVPSSARDAPSLCCWPPAYESGRLLFYGGAREISGYSASRHSWPCVSASAQLGR